MDFDRVKACFFFTHFLPVFQQQDKNTITFGSCLFPCPAERWFDPYAELFNCKKGA